MVDYVNNKENGEFMDASDLEAIETASATKQDKDIGTNNRAIVSSSTGEFEVSAATKTQIGYLSSTTSDVQGQLDDKQDIAVGTASRVLQTDVSGDIEAGLVTTAELGVLDGISASTAELNILDGVTADATEINLLDGETDLHPTATTTTQGEVEEATTNEVDTGTASKAVMADGLLASAYRKTYTLTTPEVILAGATTLGAWTLLSSTTLGAAGAVSARIRIILSDTAAASTNLVARVYLRETGSALGVGSTTYAAIGEAVTVTSGAILFNSISEVTVSLDGSNDFDWHMTGSDSPSMDIVLISYDV